MKQCSKNNIAINYGALSYQFSGHPKHLNHWPADNIYVFIYEVVSYAKV